MPVAPLWRRVRRQFSISAPRMAVRTDLAWPWRAAMVAVLLAVVAGMWYWGFDFGQIFGATNRKVYEARIASLEADAATAMREASVLRTENSRLQSDLARLTGMQASLEQQIEELSLENGQLKDEQAFLQKIVADSNKQPGLAIQRLAVERDGADLIHFGLLIVRGGSPKGEFDGYLTMHAVLVPGPNSPGEARSTTLTLPDDQPDTRTPLKLRFKYYQRVEGTFRVPPGMQLRTLTAHAYENGGATPRATRTLTYS